MDDLERDKETILEHYARMAPDALGSLTPEERQHFYTLLRLRVIVEISGSETERRAHNSLRHVYDGNSYTMMWPPYAREWAEFLRSDGWYC